ncbi:MAG TPA: beta-L-arabinofuranosidase domain-containing protein [Planctomycetota bacterium]|jgi:hypothetical protein
MAKHKTGIKPVLFTNVTISDSFWAPRIKTNREQTIPASYRQCRDTGRIEALKLQWKPGQEPVPHVFWDSDIAKWLEAASYSLAAHPDPELEAQVDGIIDLLEKMQQPDGYLNSHFIAVEPHKRWTNLRDSHEMYCAGHLIEAAVAHFQATGKRSLLNVLCRYADHIAKMFGTGPGQKRGYCGHEEIELALVKLYRATGEEKYLRQAQYFIDERGRQPHYFDDEARARGDDPAKYWAKTHAYTQSHIPVREQTEVTGHAVRGMYLCSAMADLAGELGDESLKAACERIWQHLTTKRMYVTAGIGSSGQNEGYTFDYDLPNETAYAETCAQIGLVFWAHRMLHLDCDSQYADVMERALYNSVISGVSLDGAKFFYENPLASTGQHHRQDWFGCACCPPNLARILASLGNYIYSEGENEAVVHLYVQSSGKLNVGGREVTLTQQTDYPWDGNVRIKVGLKQPQTFALKLRWPGWCSKASGLSVNNEQYRAEMVRGNYLRIEREWIDGDAVELRLGMEIDRVYANPKVRMNCGRVALQRGPMLYCLEGADNGVDLNALALPRDEELKARFDASLLGGVVTLLGQGIRASADGELYSFKRPTPCGVPLKAIPYCVWDNRAPGEMLVWMWEA